MREEARNPAIPQSRNPAIPQSRNWESQTIFTGDNLDIMRGMNSGSIDLIYLDPPFNSNKTYSAPIGSEAAGAKFKDSWTLDDVDLAWIGLIAEQEPAVAAVVEAAGLAHGNSMKAYLVMMAVRLLEMRRLLAAGGSIYLHCDPTASHYLKLVMDCVFGQENFRSEIAWKRSSAHSDARQGRQQHGRVHDVLLFYSRSSEWTWNQIYTPYDQQYIERFYRHVERGTGRRYQMGDLTGPSGAAKGNPMYEVMGVTRYWRYSQEKMADLIKQGLVVQSKPGAVPRFKRYLDVQPGMSLQDIWFDIAAIGSRAKERVGYPTQKPLALLDRIIQASSAPGDMVLDPFCGCATTCVSAQMLGREWCGIDLSPLAATLVKQRMEREASLIFRPIHRTDIPKRTDVGPLRSYKTHKHTLFGKQEGKCNGCRHQFPFHNFTVDHIVPCAKGGTGHLENLQMLCGFCNSVKGTKDQAAFIADLKERGLRN